MNSIGERLRLFADGTRIRILHLLREEPLTVAELQELLQLGQSSVSGHLSKMKHAQLIHATSEGASHRYRLRDDIPSELNQCWISIQELSQDDPQIKNDQKLLAQFRSQQGSQWIDSVAGSLQHRYTPGRNWHSLCESMAPFAQFGICVDIGAGDGSLVKLLAPQCTQLICVDPAPAMIAAGEKEIAALGCSNAHYQQAQADALPMDDNSCDSVLLLQSLQYINNPHSALTESIRILKVGGRLLLTTLIKHDFSEADRYGHLHHGFEISQLRSWLPQLTNLTINELRPEDKAPRFQTLVLTGIKGYLQ